MTAEPKIADPWIQRERERVRKWRSRRSAAGRDIAPLPPVKNPARRRACAFDFKLHCLTYHAEVFNKPFSRDHDRAAKLIERATLEGGLFAFAMPRGTGKTTLAAVAAEWATLHGHIPYTVPIGATLAMARLMLDGIKTDLSTNDLLLEDFPEVCYPLRMLEGINNRAAGQRFNGAPTRIGWSKNRLVLPTVPGSQASGAVIQVSGLLGAIRGMFFKRADGTIIRPRLVIPDDPQTDQSARNPAQCAKREEIISGAVLGLAGPGEKLSAVMPCTVIEEGDLPDRMLDRALHPEWNGFRGKMLYSFPSDMKLWDRYAELRADGQRKGKGGKAATAYYRKNRKAMDAGAEPAWPARYRDDELSAIQCAMNRYLRDPRAFAAEDQNEPLRRTLGGEVRILSAAEICEKLNRIERGRVPLECTLIEANIDVQQELLYWAVVGYSPEFGGGVVDYGTWPDQGRAYFTREDPPRPISAELPKLTGLEARIYEALERCTDQLVGREYLRDDGVGMRLAHEIIDANWLTKVVKKFCRQSKHAAVLLPSHGRGIGAKNKPISQYQIKDGEKRGDEWLIGRATEAKVRHVIFDGNHWKSFVHARLATAMGERGSLALFGDRPLTHRLFADHLTAEKATRVEAKGRTVDEWAIKPERPNNDWLDCLVGTAVAASLDGCELKETVNLPPPPPQRPRSAKRVSYF